MPRYFYTAKSLEGETKSGTLEAKDTHQLAKTLHQEGLILIKAETKEEKKKIKFGISLPFFGGVSLAEKMFFTRNLQVMISAGLPLPRALEILAEQTKSKKFKKSILEVRESVIKGRSFSDVLADHKDVFSDFFQSMARAGEEGGTLEEVLKVLTLQMEREHDLKSKIKGAMIYPAVIIFAMLGIGVLMLVMVVPKLEAAFKDFNVELPITTKLVIGLASFLVSRWYLGIIFLAVFIIVFTQLLKSKKGKIIIDTIMLKIPIFSPIVKSTNSAYVSRNLSSLVSAGISFPRALEITSNTLGNVYYKRVLIEAAEKVRKGEKLSGVLENYKKIFPVTLIQMIKVGEETGETTTVLTKLADFYEEEVSNATKNLASVIEPVLMIVIGGAVGFFAISMIQPMYSMLEAM